MTLGEKEPVRVVDDLEALSSGERRFLDDIDLSAYDMYRVQEPTKKDWQDVFCDLEDTILLGDIAGFVDAEKILSNAHNAYLYGDIDVDPHVLWKASDVEIKGGGVESNDSVLAFARDSVIHGDIESGDSALSETQRVTVHGDIVSRGNVLHQAQDSHVRGDVGGEECGHVLLKAEGSTIRGDISVWKSVLNESRDSHVHGDVETSYGALHRAEGSSITGNVQAKRHVLKNATDSVIEGNVETNTVAHHASGAVIRGDIDARAELGKEAEESLFRGSISTTGSILPDAERSLVIASSIKERGWAGEGSTGCLIAAEEIRGDVSSDIGLIIAAGNEKQHRSLEGLIYRGDWEELEAVEIATLLAVHYFRESLEEVLKEPRTELMAKIVQETPKLRETFSRKSIASQLLEKTRKADKESS